MSRPPWSRLHNRDQLRAAVLARDAGICHLCKRPGATSVDHLTPRSLGGTDEPSNLAAAHIGCNSRRGAAPLTEPRPSRRY